jgi:hypothetical protein
MTETSPQEGTFLCETGSSKLERGDNKPEMGNEK